MSNLSDSHVWFITGTSSGLGRALVEAVLRKRERVVATVRKAAALADLQAKYPPEQLLVLSLDVTDAVAIEKAFKATENHFHRLDVVVNNAGYTLIGDIEATPDDMARHQVETLFWGPVNVTKQAIRFFREVNPTGHGGRVLNVTSLGGYAAEPTIAFYCAGKFALEGFTEAFTREMPVEWNIKGVIIEPGGFATGLWSTGTTSVPPHPAYPEDRPTFRSALKHIPMLGDIEKAAQAMIRIAETEDPPLRVQLGTDSWTTINARAQGLLRDQEKWAELSHGTNLDEYGPNVGWHPLSH